MQLSVLARFRQLTGRQRRAEIPIEIDIALDAGDSTSKSKPQKRIAAKAGLEFEAVLISQGESPAEEREVCVYGAKFFD